MTFVLIFPLLSSLLLVLFGKFLNKKIISFLSPISILSPFIIALLYFNKAGESVIYHIYRWINIGNISIEFALKWDHLSAAMVLMVTGVSFLIHVYSIGYMAEDKSYSRFFAYMNLFTFFMLVLVLSSNIIMMFVGWEGVGLCSYLLIGFWFEKESASKAGMKAFIVNRIGDLGFLIGIFWILSVVGSADFIKINGFVASGLMPVATATIIGLLLFAGATGKSAQIPLYIWLPDAMEGPTPVSALIHAATMVTAGVYMIVRLNGIYSLTQTASMIVAAVGVFTAFYAATIALTQTDIKKVLAYSTISQIGYMIFAAGIGAYGAAIFHLIMHAFFKALLFLGAGSVIHAMSGIQDMRKMGGLKKYMPVTFYTFLIAGLSISGVPGFAGFFSKDEILANSYFMNHRVLWIIGIITALLTALYIFRLIFMTFYGEPRMDKETKYHIHESPKTMTTPLIILAGLSAVGGYLSLPEFISKHNLWNSYIDKIIIFKKEILFAHSAEINLTILSSAIALFGIFLAWYLYVKNIRLCNKLASSFKFFHKLSYDKYYIDEIYEFVFINPVVYGSEGIYQWFDIAVIDGIVNGSGKASLGSGNLLSYFQSGFLRDYIYHIIIGAILILTIFIAGL
jgi:NADH-quinone oxidoreductase subunit L